MPAFPPRRAGFGRRPWFIDFCAIALLVASHGAWTVTSSGAAITPALSTAESALEPPRPSTAPVSAATPAVPITTITTTTTTLPPTTTSTTAVPTTTAPPPTAPPTVPPTAAPTTPPPTSPPAPAGAASDAGATPLIGPNRWATCPIAVIGSVPGLDQVVGELSSIMGTPIARSGAPGSSVSVYQGDTGNPSWQGNTTFHYSGSAMTSASVAISARGIGDLTLLRHEISHAFGLGHSNGGLMDASTGVSVAAGTWNPSERAWLASFAANSC